MTKPTGRPRGRPKTKEYVTLMARVDITLADEVKRYASLHRQPISVVIRDALTLLMEEYPCAGDRSGPHRLAAHEFLSDRYEAPLDMLIGETDSTEVEALLSDTHEAIVETILSDTNEEVVYRADTKEGLPDLVSDDNRGSAATPTGRLARRLSRKVSDKQAAQEIPPPVSTEGTAPLLSDSHTPAYDPSKHYLGKLCPRRHDYHGTGKSLLRQTNHRCLACDRERAQERRQAQRTQ
jgi:hypothetical protein